MAIQLTQEIGRRITTITEDTQETAFLFNAFPCIGGGRGWGAPWRVPSFPACGFVLVGLNKMIKFMSWLFCKDTWAY